MPRDIAICLVRHHSRETLSSVGRHFEISNYSTVSSVLERIKERKDKDISLQKQLEKIVGDQGHPRASDGLGADTSEAFF